MGRFTKAWVLALALVPACKAKAPVEPYVTAKVERGKIAARVTATGTLSALVTVQVGSQISGRIAELHADFNSQVKKGQILAKIDPQLFDAALEQAKANALQAEGQLAQAKANAENAKLQYQREQQLFEKKLVAQADLDTAKASADATAASVQAAEGQLAQSKAQRHQAEVNLAYCTIYSPIDGTVISRAVDVGQTVAASLSAPTIFTLAEDLRKMQVDTSVAEADIGKLKDGLEATFTVDAYPNRRFKGTIRQIRNAATTTSNVVTYDAVIDVDNPDLALRPGMTANVTFVYASADDALKVPNAALRFKPEGAAKAAGAGGWSGHRDGGAGGARAHGDLDGGAPGGGGRARGEDGPGAPAADRKTVYVLRGTEPAAVPVRAGITDGSTTEIVDGELHEGDLVITDQNDAAAASKGSTKLPGMGGGGGGGRPRGPF